MRFSLSSLMGLLGLVAVATVALANANRLWAGMLLLAALYATGAAMLGSFILRGRGRCFSAGCLLFAGGYLALAFAPGLSEAATPILGTPRLLVAARNRLPEGPAEPDGELAEIQNEITSRLDPAKQVVRSDNDPPFRSLLARKALLESSIRAQRLSGASREAFIVAGHALSSLLSGLAGGATALRLQARRETFEGSDPRPG